MEKFPTVPLYLILPEELGIYENVRAIITLQNKQILSIRCGHILRYHASSARDWPELFDANLNPLIFSKEINNSNEPNSSIFQGAYERPDENYLEGDIYYLFDFSKEGTLYKNCCTKTIHFKENKTKYRI